MPIVTQGHQVQVMPQYTAMDPNRVTFNPAGFTQGALSSIELFDALAKQKAFAQAQAELAATRDGRLGAMNAQNLATIQLAPEKNLADIALAQNTAAITPGQTEATIADQGFNRDIRPFVQGAKRQQAETDDALAVARADMQIKQAKLDADKQAREEESAPLKQQLDVAKLVQEFENLDKDKSMTDTQKLATIRNTLASASKSEAEARKDDRNEGKPVDPIKELDDIQLQIQRLKSESVIDPNLDNQGKPVPYIQYQGGTKDINGNVKAMPIPRELFSPSTWLGGTKQPILNPAAEQVANQIKVLEARRAALTAQLQTPASSAGPAATPAAVSAIAPSSPDDLVAAVKAGKISKEAAKQYATSKGWK